MTADPMTMAYARLALREALRSHLFDPNTSLLDIGLPIRDGQIAENKIAIRFHVRQKFSPIQLQAASEAGYTRPVPQQIVVGGIPFDTDVIEGSYHPELWGWGWAQPQLPRSPRARHNDPLRGGISISDPYHNTFGTLGGKVIDRTTGEPMILSNWHVLAADWLAQPGQYIYQPGRLDGGTFADRIATLARHAMWANLDAAVATLLPAGRPLINDQFGLRPVMGVGRAQLGMQVVKSGAMSEITHGMVTGVEGVSPPISYGTVNRIIAHVMVIEPLATGDPVSIGGDSGSWWLDKATMQAIGLHFAGQALPDRALALDMPTVLDALNVDIATEQGTATSPQARRAPALRPAFDRDGSGAMSASRSGKAATPELVRQ